MSSASRPVYVPRQKRNQSNQHRKIVSTNLNKPCINNVSFRDDDDDDIKSSNIVSKESLPLNDVCKDVFKTLVLNNHPGSSSTVLLEKNSLDPTEKDNQQFDNDMKLMAVPDHESEPNETAKQHRITDHVIKQQRIEDYMDEKDYNEWGGPRHLKTEYNNVNKSNEAFVRKNKDDDDDDDDDGRTFGMIHQLLEIKAPSSRIGENLLRKLGWKGNETIYAPDAEYHGNEGNSRIENDDNDEEQIFLANRHLRKVQLHRRHVDIPLHSKMDLVGLGYSVYDNAPEFQRDREKRLKEAAARTKTHSNNNYGSYRISHELVHGKFDADASDSDERFNNRHNNDKTYEGSNMLLEDFIGRKSVNGFSMRDDVDDDIYDNDSNIVTSSGDKRTIFSAAGDISSQSATTLVIRDADSLPKKKPTIHIDIGNYDTVVYDHNDSDPEDIVSKTKSNKHSTNRLNHHDSDFGSLLSSWTSEVISKQSQSKKEVTTTTVIKHPIMTGFLLTISAQQYTRFRGPDIPPGYEVRPHIFPIGEDPISIQSMIFPANNKRRNLSNHVRLESNDPREIAIDTDAKKLIRSNNYDMISSTVSSVTNDAMLQESNRSPMNKSNAFTGIAASMKNRFSSGGKTSGGVDAVTALLPAGLSFLQNPPNISAQDIKNRLVEPINRIDNSSDSSKTSTREGRRRRVERKTVQFIPKPLLCKRLRVVPVHKLQQYSVSESGTNRSREEAYFQDEILARVKHATNTNSIEGNASVVYTVDDTTEKYRLEAKRIIQELLSDTPYSDVIASSEDINEIRPSLETYKSIYEPSIPARNQNTGKEHTKQGTENQRSPMKTFHELQKSNSKGDSRMYSSKMTVAGTSYKCAMETTINEGAGEEQKKVSRYSHGICEGNHGEMDVDSDFESDSNENSRASDRNKKRRRSKRERRRKYKKK